MWHDWFFGFGRWILYVQSVPVSTYWRWKLSFLWASKQHYSNWLRMYRIRPVIEMTWIRVTTVLCVRIPVRVPVVRTHSTPRYMLTANSKFFFDVSKLFFDVAATFQRDWRSSSRSQYGSLLRGVSKMKRERKMGTARLCELRLYYTTNKSSSF
jgi:hypothetical protein